jgi:hypothetical protein
MFVEQVVLKSVIFLPENQGSQQSFGTIATHKVFGLFENIGEKINALFCTFERNPLLI